MYTQRFINYLSSVDRAVQEDTDLNLSIESLIDEYASLPVTNTKMYLPPEQVPIIIYEGSSNYRYGLSLDMFGLFMEKNGMTDIGSAYRSICEANQLQPGEVALIFDSDDELKKAIQECRCCCDGESKQKLKSFLQKTGGLLKELKNHIPVAKEPSVTEIDWNSNEKIVNIEKDSNYMSSFDAEAFKTYN